MMEFAVKGIVFAGVQKRVSKKTGEPYLLAYFLRADGNIVQSMLDCELPKGLRQFDKVDVNFKTIPGRYAVLTAQNITKSISI